jgi:integrase
MLDTGRSPRIAALTRVVFRRALQDALRDGLVPRNVAALARPPHVPSRSLDAGRDYYSTDDARRLLSAGKVHPMGPLVTVAATTGLRLGELQGLAWSDLDLERGTLTVRRSLARAPDGWRLAEPKTKRRRYRQAGPEDRASVQRGAPWAYRDRLRLSPFPLADAALTSASVSALLPAGTY